MDIHELTDYNWMLQTSNNIQLGKSGLLAYFGICSVVSNQIGLFICLNGEIDKPRGHGNQGTFLKSRHL